MAIRAQGFEVFEQAVLSIGVIARSESDEAIQLWCNEKESWIASSQVLLAMT